MVTRIYDRPDLDQRRAGPALYVTGTLPNSQPSVAYEGRLQIHNAIGACTVEQIDGATLPPGHTLYVDNATSEVVLTWPAYSVQAAPIQNPGFEDGIVGWVPGSGWSVTTNNAIAGSRSAVYQRTGGSSVLSSSSRYPVTPDVPINAQCQVRQGASSAGNAGAGVRLEFRDSAGAVVSTADGNYVMSASKNAVYPSSVTATAPPGAATVNIACVGVRHRENKDVWVDTFSWNHQVAAVGINANATLCFTLRVRDSAGRTALWSGCITVKKSVYLDSLEVVPHCVWSLRKLVSTAYRSIRVRRSIDNAEMDIGFVGDDLDTAALLAFADGGSVFVTTMYDQTGGLAHFAQATAASQPRIVNVGVYSGHIFFDGENDYMGTGSVVFGTRYAGLYARMSMSPARDPIVFEHSANFFTTPYTFALFKAAYNPRMAIIQESGQDTQNEFVIAVDAVKDYTCLWDRQASPAAARMRWWEDGTEQAANVIYDKSPNGNFSDQPLFVGARSGGQYPGAIRVVSLVLYRNDTLAIRAAIQAIVGVP